MPGPGGPQERSAAAGGGRRPGSRAPPPRSARLLSECSRPPRRPPYTRIGADAAGSARIGVPVAHRACDARSPTAPGGPRPSPLRRAHRAPAPAKHAPQGLSHRRALAALHLPRGRPPPRRPHPVWNHERCRAPGPRTLSPCPPRAARHRSWEEPQPAATASAPPPARSRPSYGACTRARSDRGLTPLRPPGHTPTLTLPSPNTAHTCGRARYLRCPRAGTSALARQPQGGGLDQSGHGGRIGAEAGVPSRLPAVVVGVAPIGPPGPRRALGPGQRPLRYLGYLTWGQRPHVHGPHAAPARSRCQARVWDRWPAAPRARCRSPAAAVVRAGASLRTGRPALRTSRTRR